MKLGLYIDPANLELLRFASEKSGLDTDETLSLVVNWGFERLREGCPYNLPPECLQEPVRAPWAN